MRIATDLYSVFVSSAIPTHTKLRLTIPYQRTFNKPLFLRSG